MDYRLFERIFDEIVKDFPQEYLRGIHGIFLKREEKSDPKIRGVYRLGEYVREPGGMGDYIVLYYGSFMAVFGYLGVEEARKKIFDTLSHEVQHHLEHKSGIDTLGDEDREYMAEIRMRSGLAKNDDRKLKSEVLKILSFLAGIIILIYLIVLGLGI